VPLTEQRVALLGAGSAGCGIASLLLEAMRDAGLDQEAARARFYAMDKSGLLVEGMNDLHPAQLPFVQKREAVANWTLEEPGRIGLVDVAHNAKPTVLIGVTGHAGAFTEKAVREMARHVNRPVIFPLSNPTSRSEAVPQDLIEWTEGRALIGTGSPFPHPNWNGKPVATAQTNNAYIFPGVGLGVIASDAVRVTDAMFMAAARALAALSPAKYSESRLLPPVTALRSVARTIAVAVARQAQEDGVAQPLTDEELSARIDSHIWEPIYRPYRKPAAKKG